MFLFKKKNKQEELAIKKKVLLDELIREFKKRGYSIKQIKDEFQQKNYPDEFIDYLSELNNERRLNMVKKREDYEDTEEDEELDSEEDFDDEDNEEEDLRPKKTLKPNKVQEPTKQPKVTLNDVLQNHEQRLQNIEAMLLRIRHSI